MTRRGQSMVETLLALSILVFLFLGLFSLARMLMAKVMLEHAAMRVARARAVGLNAFMCEKAARVAAIPASGRRLHPGRDDVRTDISEPAIARMYMRTPDWSYANGLLRYENWQDLRVEPGPGSRARARMKTEWFDLQGEAEVDRFPDYLLDEGI